MSDSFTIQGTMRDFRCWDLLTPTEQAAFGNIDFGWLWWNVYGAKTTLQTTLSALGKPQANFPHTGTGKPIAAAASIAQWFEDVPNLTQKIDYGLTLTDPGTGVYICNLPNWWPVTGILWNEVSGYNGENTGWSFESGIYQFVYQTGQYIVVDSSEFLVYVDGVLFIENNSTGTQITYPLSTLGLTPGTTHTIQIFKPQRDIGGVSNLYLATNFKFFVPTSSPTFLLAGMKNADGTPLTNGMVYAYASGTTKAKAIYTDAPMTTAATQPIVLDAAGTALVYGNGLYKFVVTNSEGGVIEVIDGVKLGSVGGIQTDSAQIQFLFSGVVDAAGKLLKTGKVYHYELDGVTERPIAGQAQPIDLTATNGIVNAKANGNFKFVITDALGTVIRTLENVFVGQYPATLTTTSGVSQQIDCLMIGVRAANGDLLASGTVSWTETSGDTGATDLCADPLLTIPLPAAIRLDNRGSAHVWGRGTYMLVFKDYDGNTVWTLTGLQLGTKS